MLFLRRRRADDPGHVLSLSDLRVSSGQACGILDPDGNNF